MFCLGHNLIKIAEDTTVSYAVDSDDKKRETHTNNISPFNIFGYEHQGRTKILFFIPSLIYNESYLMIERGLTKLFNELDRDGTKRYILNIASFSTQFIKRYGEIGENWKIDFKIPPFSFTIDESIIWKDFMTVKNKKILKKKTLII